MCAGVLDEIDGKVGCAEVVWDEERIGSASQI